MPDVFSSQKRSEVMSRIRSKGNLATELALIRVFRTWRITGWRRGQILALPLGEIHIKVRPDFVFRSRSIAVFVDGEFWHGHPTKCRIPVNNREFWRTKIEGNRRRDRLQSRVLRAAGWRVLRIWQSEIKSKVAVRKLKAAGLIDTTS